VGEVSTIGLGLASEAVTSLGGAALMTAPCVGTVVAVTFVSVIVDPARFAKSAVWGPTSAWRHGRYQSGEAGHSGRISKCGDALLRSCLSEAAGVTLNRITRWPAPKGVGEGLGRPTGQEDQRQEGHRCAHPQARSHRPSHVA
jgi:transposase